MNKVRLGILGCGAIAPAYLQNFRQHFGEIVEVVACADVVAEAAVKRTREFGIPLACAPDELLANSQVELIVNLTPASVHHAVNLSILRARKHLFSEKPLALSREQGREILATAAAGGLRVGGAADTFLGPGLQFCRQLIDAGEIGIPIAAQAFVSVGQFQSEHYHNFYRGALLDLGPYYIAAMVTLLGPIVRIASAAEIRFPEKTHPAEGANAGKTFKVGFPSTLAAALTFADGSVGSLLSSCDVSGYYPRVEIHGSLGTLVLNDANSYQGEITLIGPKKNQTFKSMPGFREAGRGLGAAEMAVALRENRAPRSSGELMYHVLETMLAMQEGGPREIESRIDRPAPFDLDSLRLPAA